MVLLNERLFLLVIKLGFYRMLPDLHLFMLIKNRLLWQIYIKTGKI